MTYIPIDIMLKALQKAGKTDAQLGALVGMAPSSICRLRNGEIKNAKASAYFAIYALWQEVAKADRKETAKNDSI